MLRTPWKSQDSRLTTRDSAHGLTLIEMLISMAVTLLMMAAVVNLFANVGAGVRNRRASMELGGQLRLARARLFKDLAGATSSARPKLPSDDHDDGYIELIEGPWCDKNPSLLVDGTDNGVTSTNPEIDYAVSVLPSSQLLAAGTGAVTDGSGLGDYDDILALTVRSENEPFIGPGLVFNSATNAWQNGTTRSDLAEVIWFAVENPADASLGEPGMRTIYRRALLIAPWIDFSDVPLNGTTPREILKSFYDVYDISVRLEQTLGGFIIVPNTLSDLTKRENRFGHIGIQPNINDFPWAMNDRLIRFVNSLDSPLAPLQGERGGEDVMLNDVLAFDARVYDDQAEQIDIGNAGNIVGPADAGWRHNYDTAANPIKGLGAFVDLNYGEKYLIYANLVGISPAPTANSLKATPFYGPSALRSRLTEGLPQGYGVYDTWPYHYEDDGIDQNNGGNGLVDEGTDGLDNDNANGVDDSLERETTPPYDTPLRAMQVKIRVYERDTRQIREATVTRNFVPQ